MITTAAMPAARRRAIPMASWIGAVPLVLVVAAAGLVPLFLPLTPSRIVGDPLTGPTPRFWLGTDIHGYDLVSQFVYGAQTSLLVGLSAAVASTILSALAGLAAGGRGRARGPALALIDLCIAMPAMPLTVLLVVTLGPSLWSLMLVLALLSWAPFARVVRVQTAAAWSRDHVEAARALGATNLRIIRTAVLPEIAPTLFTKFLLTARWAILMEATLGLLGLADPSRVSWGLTLHQALSYPLLFVTDAWLWWALPPAIGIVATTLGLVAAGRDVEVRLNPQGGG
jgi:ABC-type dipeptide/oligopeptide/nickel transport system permease subunit